MYDNVLNTQAPRYRTNGRENAPALKQEEFQPNLDFMATFLSQERGGVLSPVLQTRMALGLVEAAELLDAKSDTFMFATCGFVAEELWKFGDPMAVGFFFKMYRYSINARNGDDLGASHSPMLKHFRSAGMKALCSAAELSRILYGEEHKESIKLRNLARDAVRKGSGAV